MKDKISENTWFKIATWLNLSRGLESKNVFLSYQFLKVIVVDLHNLALEPELGLLFVVADFYGGQTGAG